MWVLRERLKKKFFGIVYERRTVDGQERGLCTRADWELYRKPVEAGYAKGPVQSPGAPPNPVPASNSR